MIENEKFTMSKQIKVMPDTLFFIDFTRGEDQNIFFTSNYGVFCLESNKKELK